MQKTISRMACVGVTCVLAACASTQPSKTAQPASQPASQGARESAPVGYLAANALPNSASLVPAPPAPGSAAMARDEEINRSALAMRGTPRWEMAIRDAVLSFPDTAKTFSCAMNIPVSEERTPKLIALLRRTLVDAGRATSEAKRFYQRKRPFVSNGQPICTQDRGGALRGDGSYPSGHASVGWAFGLVLSEVSPEQTNAIIARGRAFGQSRLVCNVHWQSDVQEGQMVASAVVARLHAEPAFRNDVAAARAEVEALRAQGLTADDNCEAEAQTLKSWN